MLLFIGYSAEDCAVAIGYFNTSHVTVYQDAYMCTHCID